MNVSSKFTRNVVLTIVEIWKITSMDQNSSDQECQYNWAFPTGWHSITHSKSQNRYKPKANGNQNSVSGLTEFVFFNFKCILFYLDMFSYTTQWLDKIKHLKNIFGYQKREKEERDTLGIWHYKQRWYITQGLANSHWLIITFNEV